MGKIITVVGNLGAGKTTLTRLLCEMGNFTPYWEKPEERPFQTNLVQDGERWAFANQIDFFLFRCEQEALARRSEGISLFDGGFDQDFHVFTRHLVRKGCLSAKEFDVCKRFYYFTRRFLPPPDLILRICIDIPTLLQRRVLRGRKSDEQLFTAQELTNLETLFDDWLNNEISPVIRFSYDREITHYRNEYDGLVKQIKYIA